MYTFSIQDGYLRFQPPGNRSRIPWSTQQSAWAAQQVPSQAQQYGKALTEKKKGKRNRFCRSVNNITKKTMCEHFNYQPHPTHKAGCEMDHKGRRVK